MNNPPKVRFSHFGICCADPERSLRFYTEALGFTHKRSIEELGPPFDTLMELPGAKLLVHQITCGEMMIELIGIIDMGTIGTTERRPMNKLGMTHMTLVVDDVYATAERIEQFGGKIHHGTEVDTPFGPLFFCTDPDGVRIELMQPVG